MVKSGKLFFKLDLVSTQPFSFYFIEIFTRPRPPARPASHNHLDSLVYSGLGTLAGALNSPLVFVLVTFISLSLVLRDHKKY